MFFKFPVLFALVAAVAAIKSPKIETHIQESKHYSIELPAHSSHEISTNPKHSTGHVYSTSIDVGPGKTPIQIHFHTQSSPIKVSQSHNADRGSHQETYSEDKPHVLKHTVKRPVYQEVNEVVVPHRTITQVVKPAQEKIQTHVPKNIVYHYGHGDLKVRDYTHEDHHGYKHKEPEYGHKEHHEYKHKEPEYGHKKSEYGHKEHHEYKHKEPEYSPKKHHDYSPKKHHDYKHKKPEYSPKKHHDYSQKEPEYSPKKHQDYKHKDHYEPKEHKLPHYFF